MKILILVIFILILSVAGYFVVYNPNQLLSPGASASPSGSLNPNAKTYTNSQYGFQFSYAKNFYTSTPEAYFLKTPIVRFVSSTNDYPKTNLSEYGMTVSTDSNTSACNWGVDGGTNDGNPLRNKISINGALFYKDSISGAGAGNFYDSRIYRTVHNSQCFEIVMTIYTSNVSNYPAEYGIKEVDTDLVWAELNQLLYSFIFMK